MTPEELRQKEKDFGMKGPEMAKLLNTPYRTYLHWRAGDRRIPGILDVAIDGLEFKRANTIRRG